MSFVKFLTKYSGEILAIGSTLATLTEGLALSPKQNAKVQETIDKLQNASESILKDLKKMKEPTPVKIEKADIEKAVAAVLPKLVKDAVEKTLAEKNNS